MKMSIGNGMESVSVDDNSYQIDDGPAICSSVKKGKKVRSKKE